MSEYNGSNNGRYNDRIPGFERGYTSGGSRPPRGGSGENFDSRAQGNRFIDAGERYMNDYDISAENGNASRPPYRGGYDEPAPQNGYIGYNEPAPQNGYRGYNEPAPQNGYRGYNEPAPQNGYRGYNEPAPQNGYRGYSESAPQNGYRGYNEPAPQDGYRGYDEPAPRGGYIGYNEPDRQDYREYDQYAQNEAYPNPYDRAPRQPRLDDRFDSGLSRQEYRARLDRLADLDDEEGEPYNPYTPVHGGARSFGGFNLNNLSSSQLTLLLVGAFVVIIGIIVLIAVLSTSSCSGCSGSSENIPVVEQGDGMEGLDEIISSTDDITEIVSTSDGDVTIDEELETDTINVTVTDADGTYFRTDVKQSEAATLKISSQNETGFAFSLSVNAENASGSLAGQAYFCGEREAVYEGATGLLNFNFGTNGVTIYMTDALSAFEADGVYPDGVYRTDRPVYIEDEAAKSEALGYDANIRTDQAVRDALTSVMSSPDLTLMDFIFENGTFRVFENAEKGYDKNGEPINIDAQLGAVKYYGFINGTGEELVLICSSDAKVYVGICNGAEYHYYTNDPAYAETAPKSISGQAKGKGLDLIFN